MNLIQTFLQADLIIKATVVLLIGMSVMSWKIAIDKLIELKKEEASSIELVEKFQENEDMLDVYTLPDSGLKSILEIVLNKNTFNKSLITPQIEARMKNILEKETEDLYQGLGMLGSISSSAPFIGLFGTVWGIMNSLAVLGSGTSNQINVIAPMIGEALFVTAIGFIVAIPSSIMFNIINHKIERLSNKWLGFVNFVAQYLDNNDDNCELN